MITQKSLISYFNSQPHEEADNNGNGALYLYDISTHSLTRRLTDVSLLTVVR